MDLFPAYNRDYKTKAEAFDAWISGKDFIDSQKQLHCRMTATEQSYVLHFDKLRQLLTINKCLGLWIIGIKLTEAG